MQDRNTQTIYTSRTGLAYAMQYQQVETQKHDYAIIAPGVKIVRLTNHRWRADFTIKGEVMIGTMYDIVPVVFPSVYDSDKLVQNS